MILHCDCNSFYASCELLSRPELRGVPVAVCGDPAERHGIILAKNEPAKKYGVKTAETIWQAKKKCPDLVLLPPHHDLYAEYSRKVNLIYSDYTDLVEPFGIDESWLDVTHSLHLFGGNAEALADTLRSRVKRELGLTISVGVSFNKVFAKLGSDYKKPDATTVISPENWQEIVWPLPVGALLYVGRAAQELLEKYGVRTIGELAGCSEEMLETLMGKLGVQLHRYANGLDSASVLGEQERDSVKSVGNSMTFRKDLPPDGFAESDPSDARDQRYGAQAGKATVEGARADPAAVRHRDPPDAERPGLSAARLFRRFGRAAGKTGKTGNRDGRAAPEIRQRRHCLRYAEPELGQCA